eukprot:COSAG02_NODE_65296_length_258_cov_0.849057_1_plen_51_part_01
MHRMCGGREVASLLVDFATPRSAARARRETQAKAAAAAARAAASSRVEAGC